jgi:hypothetical protein
MRERENMQCAYVHVYSPASCKCQTYRFIYRTFLDSSLPLCLYSLYFPWLSFLHSSRRERKINVMTHRSLEILHCCVKRLIGES